MCEAIAGAFLDRWFEAAVITKKGLRRVDGTAVRRHGIRAEEGDMGLEEENRLHAAIGEEGIAVGTADEVDGLAHACLFIAGDGALVRTRVGMGMGLNRGMDVHMIGLEWRRRALRRREGGREWHVV